MLEAGTQELLRVLEQENPVLAELPEHAALIIGELSRIAGMEPKTIRFYEKAGLLNPQRQGKFRIFGKRDVERLFLVKTLRKFGISIPAIKQLLRAQASSSAISSEAYEVFEIHLAEMRHRETELSNHINLMTRLLDRPRMVCIQQGPSSLSNPFTAN